MTYHCKALGFAAALALGTGANAASITVETFTYTAFANLTTGATVVEDFETRGDLTATFKDGGLTTEDGDSGETFGELSSNGTSRTSLSSKVGSFTGLGGTGSGNTCKSLNPNRDNCTNIALQFDPDLNGQGNIVPDDGQWSINAADTLGVEWTAFLPGKKKFSSLFFAIRDAADQRAELTVTAGGEEVEFTALLNNGNKLSNNNEQLVFINFGGAVDEAIIKIASSRTNDSFTIDGAAITPVPLPAAGWLMIAGLGGLAALRRRKRTA